MDFIKRSEVSRSEKIQTLELWNTEYPGKLAYSTFSSFEEYLLNLSQQSHILLLDESKKIKGWYFDFVRGEEKWFSLILESRLHGIGLGTQLLNKAKEKEPELNGWVIDHNSDRKKNGDFYKSPLNFYLKNGFKELTEKRLELDKISAVKIKWEAR
ncbi:MAG: GNAT family N-acetyltransferase [Saprospiraceae bacterium]|nr:GNAT family N-acetyltransferase [Saprospiraceae bacterium]